MTNRIMYSRGRSSRRFSATLATTTTSARPIMIIAVSRKWSTPYPSEIMDRVNYSPISWATVHQHKAYSMARRVCSLFVWRSGRRWQTRAWYDRRCARKPSCRDRAWQLADFPTAQGHFVAMTRNQGRSRAVARRSVGDGAAMEPYRDVDRNYRLPVRWLQDTGCVTARHGTQLPQNFSGRQSGS